MTHPSKQNRTGHIGIGYELSTEYLPMIKERLEDTAEGVLSNQLQLV